MKVALVVLTYLFAGCDFLPCVPRIPFLKLWDFVLKALRTPNLFTAPIFTEEDGILRVDIDEGVKPPAAMIFSGTKTLLRKSPRIRGFSSPRGRGTWDRMSTRSACVSPQYMGICLPGAA
ncbi:unnamed protein product [Sphacelaria rigidula]